MIIDEKYDRSPCEIKTMNNDLLTTAMIKAVKREYIEIVNPGDMLPLIHCDALIKINIFNSSVGFRVLIGRVFLSTAEYMRVVDVQNLTDFEKRNFFRMKVNLNAKAYIIEDDLPADGALKLFPIHVDDLSLSGCFIHTKREMEPGTRIIINMNLSADNGLTICAEVQREQEVPAANNNGYGCSFLDISPRQSDLICTYIFDKQREQIRNMRELQESYTKD